jgi:hypothetical protein
VTGTRPNQRSRSTSGDTDLSADYAAARELGVTARECYLAGQRGALCDEQTKSELQRIGDSFDWDAAAFD